MSVLSLFELSFVAICNLLKFNIFFSFFSLQFEFLSTLPIWVFRFCCYLSLIVLSTFEFLSFATIWVLEFCHILSWGFIILFIDVTIWYFQFCTILSLERFHNLSFVRVWVLSQFVFLSFVTIRVLLHFELVSFYHHLSFWVLS